MKLPGFDGDTLVCPVGSSDSEDWKPALSYPPFKKALLEALVTAPMRESGPKSLALPPMPAALPPMPVLPPAPAMPVPSAFPLPLPASAAAPEMAAPPPRVIKTTPCPSCAHANLEEAHFCNSCGVRMDGTTTVSTPVVPPADPFMTAPDSMPHPSKPDPFAHLDPMLSYPAEPAPMSLPDSSRRALQPGKMGQLGAMESDAPPPALAPEPAPIVEQKLVPVWKRPAVLISLVSAMAIAAGAAYVMLGKRTELQPVAELSPSAPMPMPEASPTPTPSVVFNSSPPPAPPPIRRQKMKAKAKAKIPKLGAPLSFEPAAVGAKPKRARKPRPVREPKPAPVQEPGDETLIESRAEEPKSAPKKGRSKKAASPTGQDPLLESLLADATQPSAEAAAEPGVEGVAKPAEKAAPMIGQRPAASSNKFSLPGLERPVSASDRVPSPPQARAPRPPAEDTPPEQIADAAAAALAEPGKTAPPPGIEDVPAKAAEGDQLALVQVHEQFDFCAQLLAQGAYGDHYDTCLCKDTRDAAPYRGRRGFYVTAKKKEAGSGHLETTAKILSSKLEGASAMVKARWKSGTSDRGRDSTQTWKLEDGLWCQAP